MVSAAAVDTPPSPAEMHGRPLGSRTSALGLDPDTCESHEVVRAASCWKSCVARGPVGFARLRGGASSRLCADRCPPPAHWRATPGCGGPRRGRRGALAPPMRVGTQPGRRLDDVDGRSLASTIASVVTDSLLWDAPPRVSSWCPTGPCRCSPIDRRRPHSAVRRTARRRRTAVAATDPSLRRRGDDGSHRPTTSSFRASVPYASRSERSPTPVPATRSRTAGSSSRSALRHGARPRDRPRAAHGRSRGRGRWRRR